MAIVTSLGGHSGCKVLLLENEDNTAFVRKISSSLPYNGRLEAQMRKQMAYHSAEVKVPAVYQSGVLDNGLFFFDMEYVQGITMAKYVTSIEISKVRQMVKRLVHAIAAGGDKASASIPDSGEETESIFREKIAGLSASGAGEGVFQEAIHILEAHSWANFFRTQCHGDLTLENIIVKGDEFYFIDFLDSFYDSWLLDAGTLLQDVFALWSYRYDTEADINALIRLMVFRDVFLDEIKERDPVFCEELYFSLLLKLMRILPYVSDECTYAFLVEKTAAVIGLIRKGFAI